MKILVTGSNGFVGKSLCAELHNLGIAVLEAVRSSSSLIKNAEMITVGEIDGNTYWGDKLNGLDVVIHLAARVHVMNDTAVDPLTEFRKVNVEGTLWLAQEAVKAGVKRFIFISTIGVNGNATPLDCPFTPVDQPNPHDYYSISKYEAELGLQRLADETGLEVVIIRPPLVYGYGAPGNFRRIIDALKSNFPLPLGAIHNKRSFVYVGNLVDLIIRCIHHPSAVNQVFLVSDGCDLSTTELLRASAAALGVKARLLPVPQRLIETCAVMLGKQNMAQRLCGNLQVDISKARKLLDWIPPISVVDGLKAAATGLIKGQ